MFPLAVGQGKRLAPAGLADLITGSWEDKRRQRDMSASRQKGESLIPSSGLICG